jgi:hypothetical protein
MPDDDAGACRGIQNNAGAYPKVPKNANKDKDKDKEKDTTTRSYYSDLQNPPDDQDLVVFLFQRLKAEAKSFGFFLRDNLAKHLAAHIDPGWIDAPSFIAFSFQKLRAEYPEKSVDELELLFASALWNKNGKWNQCREQYPTWRKAQLKSTEEAELSREKNTPPELCQCGAAMVKGKCPVCKSFYTWDDAQRAHVFVPAFDTADIPKPWKKTAKTVPKVPEPDF